MNDTNTTTELTEVEALRAELTQLKADNRLMHEALLANEDRRNWHPKLVDRKKPVSRRGRHVYCYCRVSHLDSVESGLGLDVQVELFQNWWKYKKTHPDFAEMKMGSYGWRGGMVAQYAKALGGHAIPHSEGKGYCDGLFIDLGVSAYSNAFCARPAGKQLDNILRPGDIVVIPKMDRGFRNLRDFANTEAIWRENGVCLVFLSPDVDLSTATGMLTAQVIASVSEFHSALLSERMCETSKSRFIRGFNPNGGKARPGFKRTGKNTTQPYWLERRLIHEILVKTADGWSLNKITDYIEILRSQIEHKKPGLRIVFNPRTQKGYRWTAGMVGRIRENQMKFPMSPLFPHEENN
jgi:DNA invertase Pin-like site-specific DNA recombinase